MSRLIWFFTPTPEPVKTYRQGNQIQFSLVRARPAHGIYHAINGRSLLGLVHYGKLHEHRHYRWPGRGDVAVISVNWCVGRQMTQRMPHASIVRTVIVFEFLGAANLTLVTPHSIATRKYHDCDSHNFLRMPNLIGVHLATWLWHNKHSSTQFFDEEGDVRIKQSVW